MHGRYDIFGESEDELAADYTHKGVATGVPSRLLSLLFFPVATLMVAQLAKEGLYLLAAVVVIAQFIGPLGLLVRTGVLVFLVVTNHWVAASIIFVLLIIQVTVPILGTANAKRVLREDRPIVSPFEGLADLRVALLAECLSLGGALLTDGWVRVTLLVVFTVVASFHASQLLFRLYPLWHRLHYSLMMRYAALAAAEHVLSSSEGRSFDFEAAALHLLESAYPYSPESGNGLLERARTSKLSFSDRGHLEEMLRANRPDLSEEKVQGVLQRTHDELISTDGDALIIRYAIAELVEEAYGDEERALYMQAIFSGRAS